MSKNGSEKVASLSRSVRSIIEKEPYIRNPLAEGLINYSALARKISPRIEKDLERKIKDESLIVAIKRYADEINGKTDKKDYLDIFARSTLTMQDDVSYALLSGKDEVLNELEKLLKEPDWHSGEIRIVVSGPGRVVVLLKAERMNSIKEKINEHILDFSENNVLITMREPIESRTTYGVIAEIAQILSRREISIELVSAPPDLHFLVHEKDGEETYSCIKELIRNAKEEMKKKKE